MKSDIELIEKELSYKIHGIFLKVKKEYGCFYKEEIYQNAIEEELKENNIEFQSKPKIEIISAKTFKRLGEFIPDLVVENKIIVEIKALKSLLQSSID